MLLLVALAAIVIFAARWLRGLEGVTEFVGRYPGTAPLPSWAPVGLPAWVGWQHFLTVLLMVLIVVSGWRVRTVARPRAYWTRRNQGRFRTANPPRRISIDLWLHLGLDVLLVINGVVFIVLLFATGQWVRIVPTGWDVFPHALSAALQYASMDWPTENGWDAYNSLQQLAYFVTVFVAAPLAVLSGVRMSPAWPSGAARLSAIYRIEWARAVHFPVMLYFVLFTVVHVVLVLATGALRNLNHMYTSRDVVDGWGIAVFAASMLVVAASVVLARPVLLIPIASKTGTVGR